MKQSELIKLIEEKKARLVKWYHGMEPEQSNPQIAAMRINLKGSIDAYDAVLEAIRGNPIMLKI